MTPDGIIRLLELGLVTGWCASWFTFGRPSDRVSPRRRRLALGWGAERVLGSVVLLELVLVALASR